MPVQPRAARVTMRFREGIATLLPLPWDEPLEDWRADGIEFVELPVGPSRHVVRFVAGEGGILALKELPVAPARREYDVMRALEERGAPSVRAIGLVERLDEDAAVIVTRYLARSFQFRRLFMRLQDGAPFHRERLLDAMANLLVELHRRGVFWGDCSLANTLLRRDGQTLQAYLVDAETSEVHDRLSDGQRALDVDLAVENVAGDLADLAAMAGRGLDEIEDEFAAAEAVRERYERLWAALHADMPIGGDERYLVQARIRALNMLGFDVDEVVLEPGDVDPGTLRLRVVVAGRRYHADRLRRLTGLEAGEGQAAILLNDLTAWAGLDRSDTALMFEPPDMAEVLEDPSDGSGGGTRLNRAVAARWRSEVFEPSVAQLREALGPGIDPVQGYCDLLEVRWLLSEEQGRDVGNELAVRRMAEHHEPVGSVAGMAVAEEPVAPAGRVTSP
jgi:tRNA A-37 threonylcarbamoyl transferase component Bud32